MIIKSGSQIVGLNSGFEQIFGNLVGKISGVDRFRDKAIAAVRRYHQPGRLFGPGGHGHQGNIFQLRAMLHNRYQGLPINIGQPQIDKNQLRAFGQGHLQASLSFAGVNDVMLSCLQNAAYQQSVLFIIFDQEYLANGVPRCWLSL